MFKSTDMNELKKLIGTVNIIDIRDPEDYDKGHVETSVNIPNSKLIADPKIYLDEEKRYYIYCEKGKVSIRTCIYLGKLGYSVVNVIGGYVKYN
jgi:rhodanese-related sulfurtransferase